MAVLLLNRPEIEALLDPNALLPDLRGGFRAYAQEREIPALRVPSPLPGPGRAMILVPGLHSDIPAYSVKVQAKFPAESPSIRGAILLHDLQTGELLAIMESTYITAVRTGLVAALATDILANPEAGTVAVIGAGVQGEHQLRYLATLRSLNHVRIFDEIEEVAEELARKVSSEIHAPLEVCRSVDEVTSAADIILAATWARGPFLHLDNVGKGTHITTLGSDEPGKLEVDRQLIQHSTFICDDRDLNLRMGAIGNAGLGADAIDAELGDVLACEHPGRIKHSEITIFGSVGLAFQDLIAAWQVYRAALDVGAGQRFRFDGQPAPTDA